MPIGVIVIEQDKLKRIAAFQYVCDISTKDYVTSHVIPEIAYDARSRY